MSNPRRSLPLSTRLQRVQSDSSEPERDTGVLPSPLIFDRSERLSWSMKILLLPLKFVSAHAKMPPPVDYFFINSPKPYPKYAYRIDKTQNAEKHKHIDEKSLSSPKS